MNLEIDTRIKLNNGVEIPVLGLGTWELTEGETVTRLVEGTFLVTPEVTRVEGS